ncbi:competence/damage-inducible protein CinA [Denitrovibrio acetiphilus DSM 12809]|uniref:CinA-like protein n=1 Tax=Denitrovibrio acetiphilus (strain DSM 12809 / NBRC 114555 / N2460) TaxID=522772 RepID=D4H5V3_DENA2|nr:CinA family nicotinamide mononucleotide deamidase-related protein [Denitrovibrio acetiphilus]ADD69544.1 competence/damage-inducible protein CinA [Denitrovibrio acetiphilus DSM 12809]
MVKVAIFAIGSELLEGSIVDTNSAWLGKKLTKAGFDVTDIRLIPDHREKIVKLLREGMETYDIILTTGGLGPTFDDLTAETLGEAAGVGTEMNEEARRHMVEWLKKRNVSIKPSHERQALLPKGCMLFPNNSGTAMGFGVEKNSCTVVSMPGVPYEMYKMFDDFVMPFMLRKFSLNERFSLDLRIGGLPESDIDDVIRELHLPSSLECIINVSKGECFVKLRGFDKSLIDEYALKLKDSFPRNFIGFGDDGMAAVLLRLLRERDMTISVAESCTGGMIGADFTSVAGASDVFMGGIISYSNDVKERILRVPKNIMINHGAVSEETARAMAVGAANTLQTRCAISVTGVAGPDGGTDEKPVGTVCMGYCIDRDVVTKKHFFAGDRDAIRTRAVKTALREMTELLKK